MVVFCSLGCMPAVVTADPGGGFAWVRGQECCIGVRLEMVLNADTYWL